MYYINTICVRVNELAILGKSTCLPSVFKSSQNCIFLDYNRWSIITSYSRKLFNNFLRSFPSRAPVSLRQLRFMTNACSLLVNIWLLIITYYIHIDISFNKKEYSFKFQLLFRIFLSYTHFYKKKKKYVFVRKIGLLMITRKLNITHWNIGMQSNLLSHLHVINF